MPYTSRRIAMLEVSYYVTHEDCVATARLFAKAPEMAKMIRRLLDLGCGGEEPVPAARWDAAAEEAEKLLTEATGNSSEE